MMINKVQTAEDFKEFLQLNSSQIDNILQKTPDRILQIIADTIQGLCNKMNLPENETEQCIKKVKGRQMGYLFENMEKMDIQAERRNTQEALAKLKQAQEQIERIEKEKEQAAKKIERIETEKKQAQEQAQEKIERIETEKKQAQEQAQEKIERIEKEKEQAAKEIERIEKEKEQAAKEIERIEKEKEQAAKEIERIEKEKEQALRQATVETMKELGCSQEAIISKLKDKYKLTEEQARKEI